MRKTLKNLKNVDIPSSIFRNRSISVLEAIVRFLREKRNLTYHETAMLLNRDDRTIWTAYHRVKKKIKTKK